MHSLPIERRVTEFSYCLPGILFTAKLTGKPVRSANSKIFRGLVSSSGAGLDLVMDLKL